ncbi:hypothetical protein D917_00739 [Trichinella nativa]|uniref:Uncharacterized protein n=1 Tax=Trichinella nativa TaxID=6335 RepID=A0A1Y3E8T9_9BILA|nr:hypothetical protein D917_00739 [Trichinella nativa]
MTIRFRSDSLASNIGKSATANDQSRTCRLGKQRRYGLDKGHPTASTNENFFLFPTITLCVSAFNSDHNTQYTIGCMIHQGCQYRKR